MSNPTGNDLVAWIQSHSHGHPLNRMCPSCGQDVSACGIDGLVYTFEVCACDAAEFRHFVERIWHGRCLVDAGPDADELLAVLAKIKNLPGGGRHIDAARNLASEALRMRRGA